MIGRWSPRLPYPVSARELFQEAKGDTGPQGPSGPGAATSIGIDATGATDVRPALTALMGSSGISSLLMLPGTYKLSPGDFGNKNVRVQMAPGAKFLPTGAVNPKFSIDAADYQILDASAGGTLNGIKRTRLAWFKQASEFYDAQALQRQLNCAATADQTSADDKISINLGSWIRTLDRTVYCTPTPNFNPIIEGSGPFLGTGLFLTTTGSGFDVVNGAKRMIVVGDAAALHTSAMTFKGMIVQPGDATIGGLYVRNEQQDVTQSQLIEMLFGYSMSGFYLRNGGYWLASDTHFFAHNLDNHIHVTLECQAGERGGSFNHLTGSTISSGSHGAVHYRGIAAGGGQLAAIKVANPVEHTGGGATVHKHTADGAGTLFGDIWANGQFDGPHEQMVSIQATNGAVVSDVRIENIYSTATTDPTKPAFDIGGDASSDVHSVLLSNSWGIGQPGGFARLTRVKNWQINNNELAAIGGVAGIDIVSCGPGRIDGNLHDGTNGTGPTNLIRISADSDPNITIGDANQAWGSAVTNVVLDLRTTKNDNRALAPFAVWPSAEQRNARLLAQRTFVPDDVKLNSQSDSYGLLTARDKAASEAAAGRGTGVIQLLARNGANAYGVGQTFDLGGYNDVTVTGGGLGDYGQHLTTLVWTGAAGGTLMAAASATQRTIGLVVRALGLDGAGLADIVFDCQAVTRGNLSRLDISGGRLYGMRVDTNAAGMNWQETWFQTILIGATGSCTALFIGDGGDSADTCESQWDDLQLQFTNGDGLRVGGCDSVLFNDVKSYRLAGGTGACIRIPGGSNASTYKRWCQDTHFELVEAKVTDGSLTGTFPVMAGTRMPQDNFFVVRSQSAGIYPQFENSAVEALNSVTNEYERARMFGKRIITNPVVKGTNGTNLTTAPCQVGYTRYGSRMEIDGTLTDTVNGSAGGFAIMIPMPFTPGRDAVGSAVDGNGNTCSFRLVAGDPNAYLRTGTGGYPGANGISFTFSAIYML